MNLSTIALSLLAAGGISSAVYFRPVPAPPTVPMQPAATTADITALRQQLQIWQAQNDQRTDELAREYRAMSVVSTAIHNDLLRAEAERAAAKAQASAVEQRYRNDWNQFKAASPR